MELERTESLEETLRRTERELRVVIEISRVISQALPLRLILDRIAAEVANLLNCPFCAILLSDPTDGLLTIEGAYGLDPHYIELVNVQGHLRFDDMVGLPSGEAYRTGQSVAWEDVRGAPSFAHLREAVQFQGYVAMVAVPLSGPSATLGTLNCYHTRPYRFSQNELSLLTTIASHAAIAIHNKYLLDQLKASVTRLTDLNQILQEQHEILVQSEAIHHSFTRLVLEERGLPLIVETLASLLERGVSLYDQQLTLIAQAPAPAPAAPAPVSLAAALLTSTWSDRMAVPSQMHLPAGPHVSGPALVVPLVARGKMLGYLAVPDASELFGELEQRAIEHAATVCTLELVKQRNALEVERRLRSNFIGDLLAGRFATDQEIQRRATHLGYDLSGSYRVVGVNVDLFSRYVQQRQLSEPQVEELKQRLADLIEQIVHQAHARALVIPQGDRAIILFPSDLKAPHALDRVTGFATLLMKTVRQTLAELTISIGISAIVNSPAEFGRGYQEALEALTITRSFDRHETLVVFDDLGIYSLLLRHTSREDLLRFAHRLLDPLVARERQRSSDLIKTLEIALKHGLSPQQTAACLFVHPNTVKHRLRQVRELTGVDFQDARQVLELQLALLIRWLAGETFDTCLTEFGYQKSLSG